MAKYRKVRRNGRWITVDEKGREVKPGQGQLRDLAKGVLSIARNVKRAVGDNVLYAESGRRGPNGQPLTRAQEKALFPKTKQVEGNTVYLQPDGTYKPKPSSTAAKPKPKVEPTPVKPKPETSSSKPKPKPQPVASKPKPKPQTVNGKTVKRVGPVNTPADKPNIKSTRAQLAIDKAMRPARQAYLKSVQADAMKKSLEQAKKNRERNKRRKGPRD